MPQIIGIYLIYLFAALTLKLIKTDFYVFAFCAKFLVINVFSKYTIKYKIKFHAEVT